MGPPRQLGGAEDRRVLGHVGKLDRDRKTTPERRNLRRAPNAPRGEHRETRHVRAEETTDPAQAEVARARDEERPLFVEEGLESREVDHGRIDFDLTKVRVDRCIERQVGRHAQGSVAADAAIERVRIEEGIGPVAGNVGRAADHVRHHFSAARRVPDHQTVQVPEARRPARFVESPPGPL